MSSPRSSVVALLPAAGRAERLGVLPCSKELLPIGIGRERGPLEVAIDRPLAQLAAAGVTRALVVLRSGKWDLPAYLAASHRGLPALGYLVLERSGSILETLQAAVPFLGGDTVVLTFPDILFEPASLLGAALDELAASGADAVLAAVPTDRPEKADVLRFDEAGVLLSLLVKPANQPAPAWTWIAAAWGPRFTELLGAAAPAALGIDVDGEGALREPYPGDLIRLALERGLGVRVVADRGGRHLDIGTRDDLARAVCKPAEPAP